MGIPPFVGVTPRPGHDRPPLRLVETVFGWMRRITYKPSFQFCVEIYRGELDPTWMVNFQARMIVVDVNNHAHLSDVVFASLRTGDDLLRYPFPDFLVWFRHHFIRRMEEHEADEWFKVDGKQVEPPHGPEEARRG